MISMVNVSVTIPQIGEGLQEARVVAFLKAPGDAVKRDEPIYQMETDKAVMDVESPVDGTLVSWSAQVDDILAIGAEIAIISSGDEAEAMKPEPATERGSEASPSGNAPMIPPRTRAYAKEKGLSQAELERLASGKGKLLPEDIDAFLGAKGPQPSKPECQPAAFIEEKMASKQRLLSSRLVRGSQLVVPGTISSAVLWEEIEAVRKEYKESGSEFSPSAFTLFAYCVAKALADFPAFRSTLVGEEIVRTYHYCNLGIAVGLPGDELVIARIDNADTLSWKTFALEAKKQIEEARTGKDQANESVTVSITNMQNFGLRDAIPVVVAPAVATVFLGEIYFGLDQSDGMSPRRFANVAITFDHRLINGVGAAQFLQRIKINVESVRTIIS